MDSKLISIKDFIDTANNGFEHYKRWSDKRFANIGKKLQQKLKNK